MNRQQKRVLALVLMTVGLILIWAPEWGGRVIWDEPSIADGVETCPEGTHLEVQGGVSMCLSDTPRALPPGVITTTTKPLITTTTPTGEQDKAIWDLFTWAMVVQLIGMGLIVNGGYIYVVAKN